MERLELGHRIPSKMKSALALRPEKPRDRISLDIAVAMSQVTTPEET